MDISQKMAEKAAEIFEANSPKDEDYYKIWDSWGMTKEEYTIAVANAPKITLAV